MSTFATTNDLLDLAKNKDLAAYAKTSDLAPYAKTSDLTEFSKSSDLASYTKTQDINSVCKPFQTPFTDGVTNPSSYLSTQAIACPVGQTLSGMSIVRGGDGGKQFSVKYTCCGNTSPADSKQKQDVVRVIDGASI